MSKKELNHIPLIEHVIRGDLTQKEAALVMRLSVMTGPNDTFNKDPVT